MSALTDLGGALASTDLLWLSKDLGGGSFVERKAAISRFDTRFQAALGFTPLNKAGDTMTGLLQFSGTGHAGIKLNSLTTTQRDALTPAVGDLIYNSTAATPQLYNGAWTSVVLGNVSALETGQLAAGTGQSITLLQVGSEAWPDGNISLRSDGSAIFGAGGLLISNDGNLTVGGIGLDTGGEINISSGAARLNSSAGLLFGSTTLAGVKLNNLTTTQRNALTAAEGMLIANTTTHAPNYYTGSAWIALGSGDALTGSPLSQFAATTSSQLAGVISDETGTGLLVFGTNPTLAGALLTDRLHFSGTSHIGLECNSLTTTQRDGITAGAGSIIWNTTTSRFDFGIALNTWKNHVRLDGDTMTGNLLFTDATYDIGATGATRPRTGYFSTQLNIEKGGIGATSTDGLLLTNATAAAAGAQQYSTAIRLTGQGWKTNATAGSQATDWRIYNQPVQGAANPTANLLFDFAVNGGTFGTKFTFGSAGSLTTASSILANGVITTTSRISLGTGNSQLGASGDGLIEIYNSGLSGFTRLNFGGVTSSFPGIGRNGIFLEFLGADGSSTASVALYNTKTSSTNFERLTNEWNTNVCRLWTEKGSGGDTARALVLGADATELMRFGSSTTLSFFGATAVAKATGGENVTNNVTDTASTAGTIPDITNGTVYATDYTNLRNALFQIARMLKQDHDALRAYGLLT